MLEKGLKLGLKTNINEVDVRDRLNQNPDIIELYTREVDLFGENYKHLEETIKVIKDSDVSVYLHLPVSIHGININIKETNSIVEDFFKLSTRILMKLCEKYNIKVVIPFNYTPLNGEEITNSKKEEFVEMILHLNNELGPGRILWENTSFGMGSYTGDLELAKLLSDTKLNLCMDIRHLYNSLNGNTEKLVETLSLLKENIAYYHVADSTGKANEGLKIGEGTIDFSRIYKEIIEKDYIYETSLFNHRFCREMMVSHATFKELIESKE